MQYVPGSSSIGNNIHDETLRSTRRTTVGNRMLAKDTQCIHPLVVPVVSWETILDPAIGQVPQVSELINE